MAVFTGSEYNRVIPSITTVRSLAQTSGAEFPFHACKEGPRLEPGPRCALALRMAGVGCATGSPPVRQRVMSIAIHVL